MASNPPEYPNLMDGLLALGGPRLCEIAERAGVSLRAVPKAPGAIAGALEDQLPSPSVLREHLDASDLEAIGDRLGMGTRERWERVRTSSYDEAVLARLLEEEIPPVVPKPRQSTRDPSGASSWPELATVEAWGALRKARKREVAQVLARAMGQHTTALVLTGPHHLPHIKDDVSGLSFVAIPGGRYAMGLGDAEKQALVCLTKSWSEEARVHVRDLATIARPVHEVDVSPFLCVEAPITRSQAMKHAKDAQVVGGVHAVCLFDAAAGGSFALRSGARSLTEAEWEFVARGGGARSWLSRDVNPETYTADVLASDLFADDGHPFSIRGLGWGSWVEDGWHPSYRGAPSDGSAWEPREILEVVRGGAFLSWPWQTDGEALLLHAAHRDREQRCGFPLLVARDLPSERML